VARRALARMRGVPQTSSEVGKVAFRPSRSTTGSGCLRSGMNCSGGTRVVRVLYVFRSRKPCETKRTTAAPGRRTLRRSGQGRGRHRTGGHDRRRGPACRPRGRASRLGLATAGCVGGSTSAPPSAIGPVASTETLRKRYAPPRKPWTLVEGESLTRTSATCTRRVEWSPSPRWTCLILRRMVSPKQKPSFGQRHDAS